MSFVISVESLDHKCLYHNELLKPENLMSTETELSIHLQFPIGTFMALIPVSDEYLIMTNGYYLQNTCIKEENAISVLNIGY